MDNQPAKRQLIKGYGDLGFRISGKRWEGSVIIAPKRTLSWAPKIAEEITLESLAPVLETDDRPDLLLIGCGSSNALLPRSLREAIKAAGIGLEVMNTGGACRTYNLLMAENRRVAAALIAV